jgi:nucleotide-binding universal stress UspA family protein
MYRRIVVPLDLGVDADRALPVGAALARRIGVELDVVTVTSPHVDQAQDEAEITAHARAAGVHIDRVVLCYDDDVANGILTETKANDGLLCCATHARGRVVDRFLHSTSAQLVRGSNVPLMLVGPQVPAAPPPRFTELLLCVDGGSFDEIVAATTVWAGLLSIKVHVIQVMDPKSPADPYPPAARVAASLHERDIEATWSVLHHRHPPQGILHHAQHMQSPLIVIRTHDRHHDGPAALGQASVAVVHRSPHPVLVIPPDEADR